MRVRVDHGADAIYVNLTDRAIKDSAEVADGIVVDYDAEGRIVETNRRSRGSEAVQLRIADRGVKRESKSNDNLVHLPRNLRSRLAFPR